MTSPSRTPALAAALMLGASAGSMLLTGAPEPPVARPTPPATVDEARARARLLHETIHGALQLIHRDFFDPDNRDRIPSASFDELFKQLAADAGVEVRWLAVQGKTMNIDHAPRDDFERKAAEAIDSGKHEFEAVEQNRYRRAGTIVLHNRCLKCHFPGRTSLEDRAAGLVISMPLAGK